MEQVLSFMSDLILFTFGLIVATFWVIIFGVIAIEIWDLIFEKEADDEETVR